MFSAGRRCSGCAASALTRRLLPAAPLPRRWFHPPGRKRTSARPPLPAASLPRRWFHPPARKRTSARPPLPAAHSHSLIFTRRGGDLRAIVLSGRPREHGSCLMPPTHMFAHHRGVRDNPHRATPNAHHHRPSSHHHGSTHTHRTPTWTCQPKPHTHPADSQGVKASGVAWPNAKNLYGRD